MERLTMAMPAVMSMGFLDTKECDLYRQLQAYENTKLTPEECRNYKLFEDELISKGITFKELLEYIDKLHKEKQCIKCKWYAEFEGVCCNGDSEHRADFRNGDDTCNKFESTKSCEVNAKWIPVSERLPDAEECYLVSLIHKEFHEKAIDLLYYYEKEGFWFHNNMQRGWWNVIAWQPLPKPYERNV